MSDIKALSDYFENGAKFGEGKDAKTLSASKLQKAIVDAMIPRKPLHKKVFKVADHFFIHTQEGREGEIERKGTIGEFRKAAGSDKSYMKEKASRNGQQPATVYGDFYRDFAIVDVDAFEEWVAKAITNDNPDIIQKNKGRAAGPKENTSGIFSLADLRNGDVDLDDAAKKQTAVIQIRKDRGEALGNRKKEDSKSPAQKGRK